LEEVVILDTQPTFTTGLELWVNPSASAAGTLETRYVNSTGDSMTGDLTVDGEVVVNHLFTVGGVDVGGARITTVADPVDPTDAVNLRFMQANAGSGGGGIYAQPEPPVLTTDPNGYPLWLDTDEEPEGSGGSGWDQAATDALYVNIAGDEMTGPLKATGLDLGEGNVLAGWVDSAYGAWVGGNIISDATPVLASHLTPKGYVDGQVATKPNVTVGTVAPSNPKPGDIWVYP